MLCDALEEKQQVFLPFSPYSCALCHLRKIRFIIKTWGTLLGDQQYSGVRVYLGAFLMVVTEVEFQCTHL